MSVSALRKAAIAVAVFALVLWPTSAQRAQLARQPASAKLDPTFSTAAPSSLDGSGAGSTGAGWVTVFSDDFEGSFPGPWGVSDQQPGEGEYYWARRNCQAHQGGYSAWAVGGGADGSALACGSDYPAYARAIMAYGPFDLSDATDAEVQYYYWLNSEYGVDLLKVLVSTNGTNFYGIGLSGDSHGWMDDYSLDLTDILTLGNLAGQPEVWLAFVFDSDYSIEKEEGAYVDDVVIRKWVGAAESATPTATEAATASPTATHTATEAATTTLTATATATEQPTPTTTASATPPSGVKVFLPIVLKAHRASPLPKATATATRTTTVVRTATATRTRTPTRTPTGTRPSPTPTVPTGGQLVYRGTTSQGRDIELKVKPDRSAVTYVKLNYSFYCGGITRTGTTTTSSPGGWSIDGGSFEVEANCAFEVTGSFDPSFNSASGTWRGIACDPVRPWVEVCRGPTGTWNATLQ